MMSVGSIELQAPRSVGRMRVRTAGRSREGKGECGRRGGPKREKGSADGGAVPRGKRGVRRVRVATQRTRCSARSTSLASCRHTDARHAQSDGLRRCGDRSNVQKDACGPGRRWWHVPSADAPKRKRTAQRECRSGGVRASRRARRPQLECERERLTLSSSAASCSCAAVCSRAFCLSSCASASRASSARRTAAAKHGERRATRRGRSQDTRMGERACTGRRRALRAARLRRALGGAQRAREGWSGH